MTLGDIARASANDFVIYIDDYVPMILQFLNVIINNNIIINNIII